MGETSSGALTDVPGLSVGCWTDPVGLTGCTVVLCPDGALFAVDVRGGAPGTRETDAGLPASLVHRVHGALLTGGSAYGLDAASGVMRWLEERGSGFSIAGGVVPIVPAAVVFDLAVGSFRARPNAASGFAACEAAGRDVPEGAVGAGTGCTLAKWRGREHARKGGQGTASLRVGEHTVGALLVVNALGAVVDPQTGQSVEGAPAAPAQATGESTLNTTIGVIATDAPVAHGQLLRLAYMAHDGLAMAIRPAHTPFDGDTIFALSTASEELRVDNRLAMELGAAAAQAVATSVVRAVRAAAQAPA